MFIRKYVWEIERKITWALFWIVRMLKTGESQILKLIMGRWNWNMAKGIPIQKGTKWKHKTRKEHVLNRGWENNKGQQTHSSNPCPLGASCWYVLGEQYFFLELSEFDCPYVSLTSLGATMAPRASPPHRPQIAEFPWDTHRHKYQW